MKLLKTRRIRLLILAVGLGLTGCADTRGRGEVQARKPPVSEPAPRQEVAALPPPRPAPALIIPGLDAVADVAPRRLPELQATSAAPTVTPAHKPELTPLPPLPLEGETKTRAPDATPVKSETGTPPIKLPALVAQQVPTLDAPPPTPTTPLRALANRAHDTSARLDSYMMRLRRREAGSNGTLGPEEIVLCKFRKHPFSVYMKWVGKESRGREITYVKGQHGNKLHVKAGEGLLLPGKHMSFDVDSPLIKANSRYPITKAGLGHLIEGFIGLVDAHEKGDGRWGTVKHLGKLKRPEFSNPVEAVLHMIPPRVDPVFPAGGKRLLFFDPDSSLPVLVVAFDDKDREVEYYCHDYFSIPARLDDADFDPAQWNKAKGK